MTVRSPIELRSVLRSLERAHPADVPEVMAAIVATVLGGTDVVVYLVDFGQEVLEPLGDRESHHELPSAEPVSASIAGHAFSQHRAIATERDGRTRVWAPVIEGADVTGVLGITVDGADEAVIGACEDLGVLAGYLIAAQARVTDVYNLHRRRKSMSLAASMQWDLLPPLGVDARGVHAAGMVEPAYDVGGDCFDYAINGTHFDFCIMDSLGHGTASAVTSALAVGCYRHGRRQSETLVRLHESLDAAVRVQFAGERFVTGQLARLDTATGVMSWLNAGHPLPLHLRQGRVLGTLTCGPALPWGLGPSTTAESMVSLQPGDGVLFYTDGVVEARGAKRADFGADRLAGLVEKYLSDQLPAAAVVRLVLQAVVEHHGGDLADDATMLLVQWDGSRSR